MYSCFIYRKRNQVNGVPLKPAKHTKRTQRQADYDKGMYKNSIVWTTFLYLQIMH
jgi:hypothetical protein